MLRLLAFIAAILALSFGAVWLADRPGEVVIHWMHWRIDTSFAFLMLMTAIVTLICFVLYSTLIWMVRIPRHFSHFLQVKSDARGLDAITGAFAALALADTSAAGKQIRTAERYLGKHPVTLMLSAQLARQNGDEDATREVLEEMLGHKETARLAAKGLTEYSRAKGDIPAALTYAEQASQQMPKDRGVTTALVDLYTRQGRWQEAMRAIDKGLRKRALTRGEAQHYRAVVEFTNARKMQRESSEEASLRLVKQAVRREPGFVPAALLYAEMLVDAGKPKPAIAALEACWTQTPNQEVIDRWLKLQSDVKPQKLLKRTELLARKHPDAPASHLAVADAAMLANDWETARQRLTLLLGTHPTSRACLSMAELEEEQYANSQAAQEWRKKTANAEADPAWLCDACGTLHPVWQPHCSHCHAFDSITWRQPGLRYLQSDDIRKTG